MSSNINSGTSEVVHVEPQSNTQDFHQELPCNGRACIRCGKCRDWVWIDGHNQWMAERKYYIKRPDATCTGCYGGGYDSRYDSDDCCGGGSYYHFFCGCCFFGRHCECADNRLLE
ncbi:unnamed protein product [Adineta steineri]|uniref:Uncharacterized protein n=1 Tax=Adineta steineri TaxID=433720 RepID=A0A819P6Q1_9BILA|nr:unnamed protein product [Adineta steineri]CAF0804747.1 unnamed protein product [Adineta steineri]CAF3916787.1 unnamed protein product [Adineta steineri]CAF4011483.1 unnamed protein product [Adineta steineri]